MCIHTKHLSQEVDLFQWQKKPREKSTQPFICSLKHLVFFFFFFCLFLYFRDIIALTVRSPTADDATSGLAVTFFWQPIAGVLTEESATLVEGHWKLRSRETYQLLVQHASRIYWTAKLSCPRKRHPTVFQRVWKADGDRPQERVRFAVKMLTSERASVIRHTAHVATPGADKPFMLARFIDIGTPSQASEPGTNGATRKSTELACVDCLLSKVQVARQERHGQHGGSACASMLLAGRASMLLAGHASMLLAGPGRCRSTRSNNILPPSGTGSLSSRTTATPTTPCTS